MLLKWRAAVAHGACFSQCRLNPRVAHSARRMLTCIRSSTNLSQIQAPNHPPPTHTHRLDSLVGLFAAGCAPTATADPYGLRRSAVGMLQALISSDTQLDLAAAVDATAALQPIPVSPESRAAVLEFIERCVSRAGVG